MNRFSSTKGTTKKIKIKAKVLYLQKMLKFPD